MITEQMFEEMSGPERAIVLKALETVRAKQDELLTQGLSDAELDRHAAVMTASLVFHISAGLRRLGYDDPKTLDFLRQILGPFMTDMNHPMPTLETLHRDPEGMN